MPPEKPARKPRPMIRVERTVAGPNGATATVVVYHEAGRPGDGLRALDSAVREVKARAAA